MSTRHKTKLNQRWHQAHIRTSLICALLATPVLTLGTALSLRAKTHAPNAFRRYVALNSQAYGSMDNFDAVNDTGQECHGFEIEVTGCRASDITYTYDWNHYGVPRIYEDLTDAASPKVYIRYESGKNPDGTWKAYTAVPSGPIAPTDGHMFTDPSINFGGEHFGVGFYGVPTAVKYSWLKDDGAGNLTFAGAVDIGTPTFTYVPPAAGAPPQVAAAVVVPPPPAPPALEFGDASWVKVTRTTTHNPSKIELEELISDDPQHPEKKSWRNGEPDEVEVEWQLMQTEYGKQNGGANGILEGGAQNLVNGDEVVTVRYDYFKYCGPIDLETGEAKCDSVGPDGIHGSGVKTINGVPIDMSTVQIVGDYVGAQMAGFDAGGQLGLIKNLQPGEAGVAYPDRRIVIGGTAPVQSTLTGNLPGGMSFDTSTGILSGTPSSPGTFSFSIQAKDGSGADITRAFKLVVTGIASGNPPVSTLAPAQTGDWNRGAVDVIITATSGGGSGPVAGIGYSINGGDIMDVAGDSATFRIADEGYNFVFYWAYDTDGNVEEWQLAYIPIDTLPAVSNATQDAGLISLDAADDPDTGSGVDRIYYRIDGGLATEYTSPFSDRIGMLEYWSLDIAGNEETHQVLSINPVVSSLVLSSSAVTGGSSLTGTVTLDRAAPVGGTSVTLASSAPLVTGVPAVVTISEGATSADFSVTTTSVASDTASTITATTVTLPKSVVLTTKAAVLTGITLSPTSLTASESALLTLSLNGPAPVGGAQIALTSSNAAALPVPISITVPVGQTSVAVSITAPQTAPAASVTISATCGVVTKTVGCTVKALPTLTSLTVNPASVPGGTAASATVTLSAAAPAGGMVISLASGNVAASLPSTVAIAGGTTSNTAVVTTKAVTANTTITLTATSGAVSKTATITVTPPVAALSGLSLPVSAVTGSKTLTATVSLTSAAPAAGATVTLTSSPTTVGTVPASVKVAAGATTVTFTVTTKTVTTASVLTVTGSYAGVSKSVTVNVMPARLISAVSVAPTTVKGGTAVVGTVTLTGPATEAVVVTLKSSATARATVPASVTVPAGATSATFAVTTKTQTATKATTVTATTGTTSKTVILSVTK